MFKGVITLAVETMKSEPDWGRKIFKLGLGAPEQLSWVRVRLLILVPLMISQS